MKRKMICVGVLAAMAFAACGEKKENKRTPIPEDPSSADQSQDNRYAGFKLARENCNGSFTYHQEPPSQEEVGMGPSQPVDMDKIAELLAGDGATGWIHAAIPEHGVWVWTFRQSIFFQNYQFPLAVKDQGVLEALRGMRRHDKVRIKGQIAGFGAHKHIIVEEATVVESFDNPAYKPNLQRDNSLINELVSKDKAIVKVHSLDHSGSSLVVEYKDMVVQVKVDDPTHTKDLYRNDKITIHYKADHRPHRPLHLVLRTDVAKPVEMVDAMVAAHAKEATVEGCLVLFPQSPQINRNIFALLEVDDKGLMRTWTLANFDVEIVDGRPVMPTFDAITDKLQDAWDADSGDAQNFRNKMVNLGLRVRARGTLNVVAANQANPQILLPSAEQLEVTPIP